MLHLGMDRFYFFEKRRSVLKTTKKNEKQNDRFKKDRFFMEIVFKKWSFSKTIVFKKLVVSLTI